VPPTPRRAINSLDAPTERCLSKIAHFVGRVQHVVGGDSGDDRHTERRMPGPERRQLLSLTLRDLVRCMSPEMDAKRSCQGRTAASPRRGRGDASSGPVPATGS
jgi:hypothetical protein